MASYLLLVVAVILTSSAYSQAQRLSRDPCRNFICQNSGTCTAPADAPFCLCRPEFTGDNCQTRISGGVSGQCPRVRRDRNAVCAHGGVFCTRDSACPKGSKCCPSAGCGSRKVCTVVNPIIIDPCQNTVCLNGGTCTAPADAPTCICAPGFFGPNCEFNRNPCFGFTCLNGGRCTAPADAPYCECPNGFIGTKCETRITGGGSGQCPKIEKDSVGVCDGILCSSNSDCRNRGEICCASACGGKLCTGPFIEPEDLIKQCERIDCMPDRICRATLPCDTCEPVATCVPLPAVGEGIDLECQRQNYLQALLVQSSSVPDSYSQLKCRGPLATRSCPPGSFCVDDLRGGGTCCIGKPQVVVDKPGTCRIVKPGDVGNCGDTSCGTDDQCPGNQKCCGTKCGRFCTDPEEVNQGPVCTGGCPKGYTCEYRGIPCKPGMFCIQIVVPTCVPPTDECGGCPPGEKCELLYPPCAQPPPCDSSDQSECIQPVCKPIPSCVPIQTSPAPVDECGGCPRGQKCELLFPPCPPPGPCDDLDESRCVQPSCEPIPRCVPIETTPAPFYPCGGCDKGQVCIDTGIRCVTTPCPTFQCVANNSCGGCPPGQSCQTLFPPCLPPDWCDEILRNNPDANCTVPECKPINTCVTDPVIIDECGGCPQGQSCQPTKIVCKKAPCPSFACVPILIVDPPPQCNIDCPPNTVCELKPRTCPKGRRCTTDLVPRCTPIQLASCPKFPPILERCPVQRERDLCSSDADCNARLNQRCCPSKCNTRVCTKVPRLQADD